MKTQQVCKDFLRMQTGRELDAMEAARLIDDVWDIKVDWHEMSYALDYLYNSKEADCVQAGGFCRYIIK